MKLKKLLSIFTAVVLMLGCFGIPAFADESQTTVSLIGEKQAIIGEEYEVMLYVKEAAADSVGGISAIIEYDTSAFTLKRVQISSAFADANKIDEATNAVSTQNDGTVKVVLLDVTDDAASNNWITLVFSVNSVADSGNSQFTLSDVKLSDAEGTSLITNNLTVNITDSYIYDSTVKVNGASIRKDGAGNIRFEAEIDSGVSVDAISEIGFLMIPAVCLRDDLYNGDLTFTENNNKYTTADGRTVSIASNKINDADNIKKVLNGNNNKFYCYLTNTQDYGTSFAFAARAYVKLNDGTVIYSDNQTYIDESNAYEKDIKGGTSSKSCIATAKAIYELYKENTDYTFSDVFIKIIAKTSWTADEYKTVVGELAEVEASFN